MKKRRRSATATSCRGRAARPSPGRAARPAAAPRDDLEDSGGLEPAIPGIGRGSRGSRPSTYDHYNDDDEPPPRKRSTHDSTADLEGMYREMLREQRMLRERVEELARTSREEVRLKRRDRRRPTPDSARPSTTGSVQPPPPKRAGPPPDTWRPRRAGRRSGTAPDDHEFGRGAAAGAARPRPTASGVIRESRPRRSGAAPSVQRRTLGVQEEEAQRAAFAHQPTIPRKPRPRALKPPPIPFEARQTDAPRRIRRRRGAPPPPPRFDPRA